ncbi:MAG: hypothetical protein KH152_10150 [Finegoldia magna]|uniref:hypothetical protein n=1 Tax=Acinetobacter pittii TaxID=48296 RepID=UPI0008382DA3|nr:hypothetical protein [Acinetobacter pittii]MBS6928834.1 hypothetical protein [Finegoldia magna]MBJ8467650.1 hypothetical protein [Acinetobacter pittii]MBK1433780.1 hypothetical protein [Acinetobacter pittii]MBK1437560.1 hypothetical protein [Acinetobacter pittii]MDX8222163.1 hypothetical protein [Acinetobacter pittii]
MSGCNFEKFAKDLFESQKLSNDEAVYRSCVSRLYYAVYHRTLDWITHHYLDIYKKFSGGTHQNLQLCFDELARLNKNLKFKTISYKLKSLHDRRVKADYRFTFPCSDKQVEQMMLELEQFDQAIELLIQEYTPSYIYKSL